MNRIEEGPAPSLRETGPSRNRAATKPLNPASHSTASGRVLPMPLRWTRALIEGADGPVPVYGSAEWLTLSDDDRRKVAATCIAAEAWRLREYLREAQEPRLSRRAREIAEARRPRPGDHPGGPVPWEPTEVAAGE